MSHVAHAVVSPDFPNTNHVATDLRRHCYPNSPLWLSHLVCAPISLPVSLRRSRPLSSILSFHSFIPSHLSLFNHHHSSYATAYRTKPLSSQTPPCHAIVMPHRRRAWPPPRKIAAALDRCRAGRWGFTDAMLWTHYLTDCWTLWIL